jgi:hypothetical protein
MLLVIDGQLVEAFVLDDACRCDGRAQGLFMVTTFISLVGVAICC